MAVGVTRRRARSRLARLALTGVSVFAFNAVLHPQTADAQGVVTAASVTVAVPAGSLEGGLLALGRQANLRMLYPSSLTSGKRTAGVSGRMTTRQAVTQLLAGTGLHAAFTGTNTVTLTGPATSTGGGPVGAAPEGAIALDTINVSGVGGSGLFDGGTPETPFTTPAPTSFISQESIERFRGSSPADIFRGTPGVLSGEARNGGGSIDPNIRGMQGMGRVSVTIDGAENAMTVYQGYQGISNRTFVDPDFLAGVDILKGADAGSRGVAGTISMRTLSANDVVKPGESWGVQVKGGFGTNTATPVAGNLGGYSWPISYYSTPDPKPVPTATSTGMDRPSFLSPTNGSFSVVAAVKEDNYDLLGGYAYRQQGNYFAGKNGRGAGVYDAGPSPLCYSNGFCYNPPHPISYDHNYRNTGLTSYRRGEQVLNTQLQTESYLFKGTIRTDNDQTLQLGYTGYRSKAGDMVAALFGGPRAQSVQQRLENDTQLDSGTLRYRWNPSNNDLVDLRLNLWTTTLTLRTPPRISAGVTTPPETFGLSYNHIPGSRSVMRGGDISNKSHVALGSFGVVDLEYGASYIKESTKPLPFSNELSLGIGFRDGSREETGGFGKVAYKPVDWLTLNGGLRYSYYQSDDHSLITKSSAINYKPDRKDGGYSPSAGITIEPIKGAQLYANYASTLRMPSLFESVAGYSLTPNSGLKPERSNSWEIGANLSRDGLFLPDDKVRLKFGYFNWDVKDYVARQTVRFSDPALGGFTYNTLQVTNIDRAKFEGLEMSARYENGGFTADFSANYYLGVEYCITAATCSKSTLSGDYATNQVPPEYMANLTVSQKFLNDDLTLGGRVTYTGPRSIGHGEVQYGAAAIIAPIDWRPYWMLDLFAEYKLSKDITMWAAMENVTDQYYVDPLSLVQQPGPGRTFRMGLTGKFGGSEPIRPLSFARLFAPGSETKADWSGFHIGGHGAYDYTRLRGQTTALDGSSAGYAGQESPRLNAGGFSFGLNAGYDAQFANGVVVGLEGDISKSESSGTQLTMATEGDTGPFSTNLLRSRQYEATQKSEIDWISTIRGRLGYAFNDRLMVYGTGGIAFASQHEERTQFVGVPSTISIVLPPNLTRASFVERENAIRVGYVIGGGAEYALGGGWSVKGEYLLASFAEKKLVFPNAKAGVMIANGAGHPATANTTNGRVVNSKLDIPMVKLGVNYRF
ncbi:hemoglobin/transferrin/lactoferrin receptor protein [Enterovirga rhinocerotis]|uniref:Hemoglobin/transferrin/lactoferrin receptor protein n=2 Tax=Enterovirga rhinocerotis TaxID=1339210 RepID=A0A4R7CC79_9HYPH|nr:hemoglobin/transferrin/lactoferrin receptor protein [Enterovirga rhinocerotis]